MQWFVATIADRAALDVLLDRVRAELDECRQGNRLADEAQAFLVGAGSVVRIYLNEPARRCVGMLAGLALIPTEPPANRDRLRSLIEQSR